MPDDEQPVPEQIRDTIEASKWPELSIREVMDRTGLTMDQVVAAAGSMDRLELDRSVGAVRLPEDPGGEFVDDHERLLPDGGEEAEELYRHAVETWGEDLQIQIAIEESNELGAELSRYLRGTGNVASICEEIADVEIMLEQLRLIFDEDFIDSAKQNKLGRLSDRLDHEDGVLQQ